MAAKFQRDSRRWNQFRWSRRLSRLLGKVTDRELAQIAGIKVVISLPDAFLRRIDREATIQGRSRSELIREAVRRLVDDRGGETLPWSKAVAKLRWLQSRWDEGWDSTGVIRRDRKRVHGADDHPSQLSS